MTLALKEWPAVIQSLDQGSLIFLLRKGGIHEQGDRFTLPEPRAVLFPSYEHQKNEYLKSSALPKAEAYQVNDRLILQNWVEFVNQIPLPDLDLLPALSPYHIWTDEFLCQRYRWKPERPLVCVFCRTFRLNQPVNITYRNAYGGCRSFIEIREEIEFRTSQPVMPESSFSARVNQVKSILRAKGDYS